MIEYKELIGSENGKSAFVVGSGTSVYSCMKDTPELWSKMQDHVVVSVNASILTMPEWDESNSDHKYWLSVDSLCIKWSYFDKVLRSKAKRVVRSSWKKYEKELPEDFYYFTPRDGEPHNIRIDQKGVAASSSNLAAADFAIQLGCKNVFYLGMDQYFVGKNRYFWQLLPPEEQPDLNFNRTAMKRNVEKTPGLIHPAKDQLKNFNMSNKVYPALKKYATQKGAKIWNCNPRSAISDFTKITLKEAFDKI
jgi:hypothetical protein